MPNKTDSIEIVFIKQLAKKVRENIGTGCKKEDFNSEKKSCLACDFFNDCYLLADTERIFKTPL